MMQEVDKLQDLEQEVAVAVREQQVPPTGPHAVHARTVHTFSRVHC